MKRTVPGIIIMTVALMFSGCGNPAANHQAEASSGLAGSPISSSPVSSSATSRSDRPSDHTKTYTDESHKDLQFGKLSIAFADYHIVSEARKGTETTFQCNIDEEGFGPVTDIRITVREAKKQKLSDTESIESYLRNLIPDYEKIKIYDKVTDASGINGLYSVSGGGLTDYVICYQDACYFVESDFGFLETYLFQNDPAQEYEVNKQKIECAGSFSTNVNTTVSYHKNEAQQVKYTIVQGKGGKRYSAELRRDEEDQFHFTLKNENAKTLLALSTYGEYYDVIQFLDVNRDGYVDIRFLEQPGTFNNSYALYVWDASAGNFVKVKCKEMLSEFDVRDGYLLNHQKNDECSGVIQKLVWDKNALLKESEESYQTDECRDSCIS